MDGRRRAAGAVLGVVLSLAGAASAQVPPSSPPSPGALAEARRHFDRGIALFEQRDHGGALAEFLRAYDLSGRPSVLFNIGAAYQALHRYPEALDALRRYLAATEGTNARERAAARRAVTELEGLVGRLRVGSEPAGAAFTIDGRPVAAGADEVVVGPGPHTVEAALTGYRMAREEVMLASGETRAVRLALVPLTGAALPPATPPAGTPALARLAITGVAPEATVTLDGVTRPASAALEVPPGAHDVEVAAPGMRPWQGSVTLAAATPRTLRVTLAPARRGPAPGYFWAAATATGLLAAGWITAGVLAVRTHDDYNARPQNDPELDALERRGRALAVAADVMGVAALAAGVTAVYLFLRTDFSARASQAELTVAPAPGGAVGAATLRF